MSIIIIHQIKIKNKNYYGYKKNEIISFTIVLLISIILKKNTQIIQKKISILKNLVIT